MPQVTFTVYGKPEPQGSKRGFVVPGKDGRKPRAVVVDTNQKTMRSYRAQVTLEAIARLSELCLKQPMAEKHVPVALVLEFMFLRPASTPKSRVYPVVKPDIDKLERSTLDALTGVLFADDAQVVMVSKSKVYGPIEKVHVSAHTL